MSTVFKGQTFKLYLRPRHGIHPAIRATYRGLWPEARALYFRRLKATSDEDGAEAVIIETMKALLVSWNLVYPPNHPDKTKAGQPVPITIEALRDDVMTQLRDRMLQCMTWQIESDIDPTDPLEDQIKQIDSKASDKSMAEIMAGLDAEMVGN